MTNEWTEIWQMEVNVGKRENGHFGKYTYSICSESLQSSEM